MNDLKTAKDELYASQEKLAQVHFEQALQKMADNINESKIKYESEYQQLMEDFAFDVQKKIIDGNEKLQHLQNEIKKNESITIRQVLSYPRRCGKSNVGLVGWGVK